MSFVISISKIDSGKKNIYVAAGTVIFTLLKISRQIFSDEYYIVMARFLVGVGKCSWALVRELSTNRVRNLLVMYAISYPECMKQRDY